MLSSRVEFSQWRELNDNRFAGDRRTCFGGVVGVIQTNTDELSHAANAWTQPRATLDER